MLFKALLCIFIHFHAFCALLLQILCGKNYVADIFSENLLPYLTIGSNSDDQSSFSGMLDEFVIFNKLLSSDDIKELSKKDFK